MLHRRLPMYRSNENEEIVSVSPTFIVETIDTID